VADSLRLTLHHHALLGLDGFFPATLLDSGLTAADLCPTLKVLFLLHGTPHLPLMLRVVCETLEALSAVVARVPLRLLNRTLSPVQHGLRHGAPVLGVHVRLQLVEAVEPLVAVGAGVSLCFGHAPTVRDVR